MLPIAGKLCLLGVVLIKKNKFGEEGMQSHVVPTQASKTGDGSHAPQLVNQEGHPPNFRTRYRFLHIIPVTLVDLHVHVLAKCSRKRFQRQPV